MQDPGGTGMGKKAWAGAAPVRAAGPPGPSCHCGAGSILPAPDTEAIQGHSLLVSHGEEGSRLQWPFDDTLTVGIISSWTRKGPFLQSIKYSFAHRTSSACLVPRRLLLVSTSLGEATPHLAWVSIEESTALLDGNLCLLTT